MGLESMGSVRITASSVDEQESRNRSMTGDSLVAGPYFRQASVGHGPAKRDFMRKMEQYSIRAQLLISQGCYVQK